MESQISVTVPTTPAGAVILRKFAAALDGAKTTAAPAADDAPVKGKRGRPSKAEMEARKAKEAEADEFETEAEEDVEEDEAEEDEADDEREEEDEEEDEADEEEAPPAKKKAKGPSLEADIIPAFQAYAKRHSREKAGKILAKFKAKAVRDIPPAKFPEVLKLLKG